MKFAAHAVRGAEGVRLAHTLATSGRKFRKGHLLTAADIPVLLADGIETVTGARLEADDLDENAAAAVAAALLAGAALRAERPAQGRCNLTATSAGLLLVDGAAVERLNRIDEALTLGTLPPYTVVSAGQVVATLKTIPLAVAGKTLAAWRQEAAATAVLRLAPFTRRRVALVCSQGAATTDKLLTATEAVTRRRVEALGSELVASRRCAHEIDSVRQALDEALAAGAQLILVAGAAVSKDRGDTVPAAVVAAGGDIVHFGMPVEPGNMLLLARLDAVPVINLPGCARSSRTNALDWVMQRLLAGLPVGSGEIAAMGAGGLLFSGAREAQDQEPDVPAALAATISPTPSRIAALVLAAGRSSRMGAKNKLLCPVDGLPMLLHAINAAAASRCVQTLLVTGHEADTVEALVAAHEVSGLVSVVRNADHATGMASSLRCGLRALPRDIDGVVVLLADMPHVTATHIDRLIAAFDRNKPAIVVPEKDGRRGNPVLWPRRHFPAMLTLSGDQGARGLLETLADEVVSVAMTDDAIFHDIDTPAALARCAVA